MKFSEIILENRIDDLKNSYGKKFTQEQMSKILDEIPQKFLMWVGKSFDTVNFEQNFPLLVDAIKTFERISSNLPQPDINEYKNAGQLIQSLKDYHNKQRREVKKVEGGNVVYEDPRFFVVNPQTHQASCYYGKGTKWCTAADSDYQFIKYNEDGKLFYILDKTKATNDPLYKIAILQKFNGDKSVYDAVDEVAKNLPETLGLVEYQKISDAINSYMEEEYAEQLKVFRDKEEAKKERERQERLRIKKIQHERQEESQERRQNNEWELGPNCPNEGLLAHALLNYLVDTGDVEVLTNEDRVEIDSIQNQIDELQGQYDNSDEVESGLLDQIESLEEEIESLKEDKVDVYNIIPTGSHYNLTEFELIDSSVDGRRYAAGFEGDMDSSCYEYVEGLIDDIGYSGFREGFAQSYIDEEAVADRAHEIYNDDVYENPDSYFNDEDRQLSDEQDEKIEILKMRIEQAEKTISSLEEHYGSDDDSDIDEKIEELNERIEEYNDEITEIEENPEGEFPDDIMDEKVDELVNEVKRDPQQFMDDFGLEWEDYIDKDDFIQGVIDADGYGGCIGSYDGSVDEVRIQNDLIYVIRID
jgi:signal peptidase I